ncbi:MAG: hypothetical protein G01um101416_327 [Microgenomates group bacterium Gr01-1014_16]|nr:MAG: hypothetical protein G01um101416_327 [Microgenomates group bacterium Gr01-1014_16]
MRQKVIKTGNSLGVTIPSQFVKVFGIQPGQTIITQINLQKARLTHTFTGVAQLSLLSSK